MSIYAIILTLFTLTLVSAQQVPVITGYARKLEDSDKGGDAQAPVNDDEQKAEDGEEKGPET